MTISDEQIISEAIRLVNEGVKVTFPVNGCSMLPFIVGGKDSVILAKPDHLRVGQVVLAWVENNRYVVHRIHRIEGNDLWLMGDGNLCLEEHCTFLDVKALATHVVKTAGKPKSLYTKPYRIASRVWTFLRPMRKWLLLIYRILHRVNL